MASLDRQLKALANKRRLAIIRFLREHKEASVGDIADHLHLSFKATSKHLSLLTAAELLDKEQRSKNVFYYLSASKPVLLRHILSLL